MTSQRVVVVATPALGKGFALTGVRVHREIDGLGAAKQLERLIEEEDVGVVLVEQALYEELPEEIRRALGRDARPIIIPVPSPNWTEESKAHDYIVEILRRAIGYRVKLQ